MLSLQEGWDMLETMILADKDWPAEMKREMKRSFYAGASCLCTVLIDAAGRTNDEQEGAKLVQKLHGEAIEGFMNAIGYTKT